MAAEVLGGAVQDEPGALLDRALQDGRGEGVVREQRDRAAGVGEGPKVEFGEGRIGRRLDQDQARVGAQRVRDAYRVDPGDLGAEQPGGEEMVAAAVQGSYGDDVAQAHRGADQEHGGQCGHAAGEGDRALGAFEAGEGGLEAGDGRVAEPSVDRRALRLGAVRGEGVDAGGLAAAVVRRVGGRQVDRRSVQAQAREVVAAGVHGLGGQCSRRGACVVVRVRAR